MRSAKSVAVRSAQAAEIRREIRIPLPLKLYPALDLAKGDDAQEQALLVLVAEPCGDLRGALGSAHRRDDVGVEEIHQKATSRGCASARSGSGPG